MDGFKFTDTSGNNKVQEEGRKGEPGTVRPAVAGLQTRIGFLITRRRRPAGRDPTFPQSRDWSSERRNNLSLALQNAIQLTGEFTFISSCHFSDCWWKCHPDCPENAGADTLRSSADDQLPVFGFIKDNLLK